MGRLTDEHLRPLLWHLPLRRPDQGRPGGCRPRWRSRSSTGSRTRARTARLGLNLLDTIKRFGRRRQALQDRQARYRRCRAGFRRRGGVRQGAPHQHALWRRASASSPAAEGRAGEVDVHRPRPADPRRAHTRHRRRAEYEIYAIINQLAAQGKGVIVISSELPELLGMPDGIYTVRRSSFTDCILLIRQHLRISHAQHYLRDPESIRMTTDTTARSAASISRTSRRRSEAASRPSVSSASSAASS